MFCWKLEPYKVLNLLKQNMPWYKAALLGRNKMFIIIIIKEFCGAL